MLVLDTDVLVLADLHELFISSEKMLTLVENLSDYYIEEGAKQKPWPALVSELNKCTYVIVVYSVAASTPAS